MNGTKSMYVDSSACVRIDSGVRPGCIMFPWLFNVYKDAVIKEVKIGMGRRGQCKGEGEGKLKVGEKEGTERGKKE